MDGEDLGDKFLCCIVNYCQPIEWSRGVNLTDVSDLLRNSARDGRVGLTIGCHPHFADHMSEERWEQFEKLISSPSPEFPWLRVVAVGECGLDYSYSYYFSSQEHSSQSVCQASGTCTQVQYESCTSRQRCWCWGSRYTPASWCSWGSSTTPTLLQWMSEWCKCMDYKV